MAVEVNIAAVVEVGRNDLASDGEVVVASNPTSGQWEGNAAISMLFGCVLNGMSGPRANTLTSPGVFKSSLDAFGSGLGLSGHRNSIRCI
jgi:hypothetical protein